MQYPHRGPFNIEQYIDRIARTTAYGDFVCDIEEGRKQRFDFLLSSNDYDSFKTRMAFVELLRQYNQSHQPHSFSSETFSKWLSFESTPSDKKNFLRVFGYYALFIR